MEQTLRPPSVQFVKERTNAGDNSGDGSGVVLQLLQVLRLLPHRQPNPHRLRTRNWLPSGPPARLRSCPRTSGQDSPSSQNAEFHNLRS